MEPAMEVIYGLDITRGGQRTSSGELKDWLRGKKLKDHSCCSLYH